METPACYGPHYSNMDHNTPNTSALATTTTVGTLMEEPLMESILSGASFTTIKIPLCLSKPLVLCLFVTLVSRCVACLSLRKKRILPRLLVNEYFQVLQIRVTLWPHLSAASFADFQT